jgi:hypothetical protein
MLRPWWARSFEGEHPPPWDSLIVTQGTQSTAASSLVRRCLFRVVGSFAERAFLPMLSVQRIGADDETSTHSAHPADWQRLLKQISWYG